LKDVIVGKERVAARRKAVGKKGKVERCGGEMRGKGEGESGEGESAGIGVDEAYMVRAGDASPEPPATTPSCPGSHDGDFVTTK